jgi:diguanylate cyclase (GGDEF)-like protein
MESDHPRQLPERHRRRGTHAAGREAAVRMRALSYLFLAGATIGLVSLFLPHSRRADDFTLLTNIALAYAGAAAVAGLASRLPPWCAHVFAATGTLLVTRSILYSGEVASYYAIWYVWIALYACYFFTRPQAAAHIALVGVSYGVVLGTGPDAAAAARWLTTICTLVIAAVFIDTLVRLLRRQAHSSDENARRLGAATAAVERMASCSSRTRLFALMAQVALEVGGAERASIWRIAPASEPQLVGSAGPRASNEELEREAGAAAEHVAGAAAADGQELMWLPLEGDGEALLRMSLSLPAISRGDAAATAQVLDVLAKAFSSALERLDLIGRLENAARTDELCGLPNRRAWEEDLPGQLAQARRFAYPLSVLVLDLDGLKQLNDTLGHQAGDDALRQAAQAWSAELRDVDTLVRWGGDEFALILPGCDLAGAAPVADRIRAATPPEVTCSGGLAQWDGTETGEELVARADRALYEAKASGRNSIVLNDEAALAT